MNGAYLTSSHNKNGGIYSVIKKIQINHKIKDKNLILKNMK